jgi:hypothetical protein
MKKYIYLIALLGYSILLEKYNIQNKELLIIATVLVIILVELIEINKSKS